MKISHVLITALAIAGVSACGGGGEPPKTPDTTGTEMTDAGTSTTGSPTPATGTGTGGMTGPGTGTGTGTGKK